MNKITGIRIDDSDDYDNGALVLTFDNGKRLSLYDDDRQCCEYRYITTDDDLGAFIGAQYLGYRVLDAADRNSDEGDAHEVQFLVISTSLGVFVCETHNEHNGYYSGFNIVEVWNNA